MLAMNVVLLTVGLCVSIIFIGVNLAFLSGPITIFSVPIYIIKASLMPPTIQSSGVYYRIMQKNEISFFLILPRLLCQYSYLRGIYSSLEEAKVEVSRLLIIDRERIQNKKLIKEQSKLLNKEISLNDFEFKEIN